MCRIDLDKIMFLSIQSVNIMWRRKEVLCNWLCKVEKRFLGKKFQSRGQGRILFSDAKSKNLESISMNKASP